MNSTDKGDTLGSLSYLILMSIEGPVGNAIIILAVALDKNLRSCTDAFIVNVAVMDFIASAVLFPSMIQLLLNNRNIYPARVCQLFGFFTVMLAINSLASLTVVAVNRYILICKTVHYKTVFSRRNMALFLVGCWLYGFIITLPTIFGWSAVGYRPLSAMCAYDHKKHFSHLIFMIVTALGIPMTVTYSCYALIAYKVYKSKQRVAAHASAKRNHGSMVPMFVVSAVFTLFWLPYGVATVWDTFQPVPADVYMAVMWLGMTNSCVNSIVLGMVNKKYRAAYKKLICFCKKHSSENNADETVIR